MMKALRRVAWCTIVGVGAVVAAPGTASAGEVGFTSTDCTRGITIDWTDTRGLATTAQVPPADVWTMVVERVTVNGTSVGFTTQGPTRVLTEPVTATGVVTVEITVHWHADRPNGTVFDTVSMPRVGTVACGQASLPGTPSRPTTAGHVGSTSTMIEASRTLPETGNDPRKAVLGGAAMLGTGIAGVTAARRRRPVELRR